MTEHPQSTPPRQPYTATSGNPADDRAFLRALHQHVDDLATTITFRDRDTIPARASAADERRRQIAAAWVYLSCVAVWAEDHDLVAPLLRRNLTGLQRTATSGTLWLARAFQQLTVHPSTQWLMHPDYHPMLWAGTPHPHACHALIDWWATEAPTLAHPSGGDYPTSITGWVIGDLLPVLDPQQRTGAALVQTPHYVADFLLERTLLPAAAEFHDEPVLRLIDPACGTGHFLIRAVDYLWQWYTTGRMAPRAATNREAVTGGPVLTPAEALHRIITGVHGVDINPLTAAVGRLRVTVYLAHLLTQAGHLSTPLRLTAIPAHLTPHIAVGDSLLLGILDRGAYARIHPHLVDLPGAAFPRDDFDWPTTGT